MNPAIKNGKLGYKVFWYGLPASVYMRIASLTLNGHTGAWCEKINHYFLCLT